MSVLSNFLRKRHEAKAANAVSKKVERSEQHWDEGLLEPLEPPILKPNNPGTSATKAVKETADLIPAWMISIGCIVIARYTGVEVNAGEAAAVVAAATAIWKFGSKFYRDVTKPRFFEERKSDG